MLTRPPREHALETLHDLRKLCSLTQFDEAVPVIGHQHPAQATARNPEFRLPDALRCKAGESGVGKYWPALMGYGGEQIDLAGQRATTDT